MKIHLVLFLSSVNEPNVQEVMMKTVESPFRPVQGDILDDPGFHSKFHNGYEVAKVTINYAADECWVSLSPLAIEVQEWRIETYINNLREHGWRIVSKEELQAN
ncbi:hypothetical protein [Thalassobacillus pellis]|uniref:hypothetical protein n=1 Tax=Thalassobacillus pellis TaxID=748008 RepID=UPI00195FAD6B|nr:hypothetical protein [Thalassobacillus pellis]MBM7553077.1 hypothetical protein [Thalassobacillus pellis]